MKILMIVAQYPPHAGGLEKQAKLLSETLCKNVNVTVLTGNLGGNFKKKENINGVSVVRYFARKIPLPFVNNYIKNFIGHWIGISLYMIKNRKNFDIYHVHQMRDISLLMCFFSKIFKKPLIVKVANSGTRFDPYYFIEKSNFNRSFVINKMVKNIDYVISINRQIKKELFNMGFADNQIHSISNGVEISENFNKPNLSIRRELKINEKDNIITYVGSLTKKKNVEKLLHEFSLLFSSIRSINLLIAGQGPEEANLKQFSKKLLIHNNVFFLGFKDNIIDLLKESDIFVLPSLQEGMPNVILEAGTVGLATICSDIPGNNDIIINERNGYLFDLKSDGDLCKKMNDLLQNQNRRQSFGTNLQNHIKNNYSIDKIADEYLVLYQKTIDIH